MHNWSSSSPCLGTYIYTLGVYTVSVTSVFYVSILYFMCLIIYRHTSNAATNKTGLLGCPPKCAGLLTPYYLMLLTSTLDSATDMVYGIIIHMDSTRWQHYIEMGQCMSAKYRRELRYICRLNIVSYLVHIIILQQYW